MSKVTYKKVKWESLTRRSMILFFLSLMSVAQVSAGVIFRNDFNDDPTGKYTLDNLNADWNNPNWSHGVREGRVFIVEGEEAFEGKSMRVFYPVGWHTRGRGAQWVLRLDKAYDELYISFRLKFIKNFEFVKGGKVPGFAGGAANTGGNIPSGLDGWSARMMWLREGKVIQYVYHPDQPGKWGDNLAWNLTEQRYFKTGVWHIVKTRIVMNTPGRNDGIIQSWFDEQLSLNIRNMRFRDNDSFAIDKFLFVTFFGGDSSYAAKKDEYIFFDDFIISTEPINTGNLSANSGGSGGCFISTLARDEILRQDLYL